MTVLSDKRISSDILNSKFLAEEIIRSGFFDSRLYRKNSGLFFLPPTALAVHYVLFGEKKGLRPHQLFDPEFYKSANPDLEEWPHPLLTHFVRHGHSEGRSGVPTGAHAGQVAKSIKRTIIDSGEFSLEYYQSQTDRMFSSLEDAVKHYLDEGENRNLRPSPAFDPKIYRSYSDLKDYPALFYHFLRHGRSEGRVAHYDFSTLFRPGKKRYRQDLSTLILAVHEASLTGAPILGVNILEELSESHNVVFWTYRTGPLVKYASEYSVETICADSDLLHINPDIVADYVIGPILERFDVKAIIVNSVEASPLAVAGFRAGLPVVSLIHEFATYTAQQTLANAIDFSQAVVFSSVLTQSNAQQQVLGGQFRHSYVYPQGKSVVPKTSSSTMTTGAKSKSLTFDKIVDGVDFTCIGCGYVHFRKGVDLFIAVASQFKAASPDTKFKFIWIGDGFEPDSDLVYSVWLRDQIVRSGLDDIVHIIPAVNGDELDKIYRKADAMLLSSRLDPFPNVAIDAITSGLPLVTFAAANGVAEYLESSNELRCLVVPYLDVQAAATALVELLTDEQLRHNISNQLRALAAVSFDMKDYVRQLEHLVDEAIEISNQERLDISTILKLGPVSREMLGYEISCSDADAAKQYVRNCATRLSVGYINNPRRPVPGFSPHTYLAHHEDLDKPPYPNAYAHWLRAGSPPGEWCIETIPLEEASVIRPSSALKVALQLHLHFVDEAGEIARRLALNSARPDIFVSITDKKSEGAVRRAFSNYDGKIVIEEVPNRGRDVGPFLSMMRGRYHHYDVIGHLHGKKSADLSAQMVHHWRTYIYETLIGGKFLAMDQILRSFELEPDLGLVFPDNPQYVGWTENRDLAEELLKKMRLPSAPNSIEFPVGNMFFGRAKALQTLFESDITLEDLPGEPVAYDGTVLHALERITPLIVRAQGFQVRTVFGKGLSR